MEIVRYLPRRRAPPSGQQAASAHGSLSVRRRRHCVSHVARLREPRARRHGGAERREQRVRPGGDPVVQTLGHQDAEHSSPARRHRRRPTTARRTRRERRAHGERGARRGRRGACPQRPVHVGSAPRAQRSRRAQRDDAGAPDGRLRRGGNVRRHVAGGGAGAHLRAHLQAAHVRRLLALQLEAPRARARAARAPAARADGRRAGRRGGRRPYGNDDAGARADRAQRRLPSACQRDLRGARLPRRSLTRTGWLWHTDTTTSHTGRTFSSSTQEEAHSCVHLKAEYSVLHKFYLDDTTVLTSTLMVRFSNDSAQLVLNEIIFSKFYTVSIPDHEYTQS